MKRLRLNQEEIARSRHRQDVLRNAQTLLETEPPPASVEDVKRSLLHLKRGELYRAPSRLLPLAGLGLFCERALAQGELITYYDGAYLTWSEYKRLDKDDPDYIDYAQVVEFGYTVAQGNYRRDPTSKALVQIPYEQLGDYYQGRGAHQFMNGGRNYETTIVNVGSVIIKDKFRAIPPDCPDPVDCKGRLAAAYPEGILLVAVALEAIPAHTELIMVYGDAYMDILEGNYSSDDDEEEEEEEDEDEEDESSDLTFGTLASCCLCKAPATLKCPHCQELRYCSSFCSTVDLDHECHS